MCFHNQYLFPSADTPASGLLLLVGGEEQLLVVGEEMLIAVVTRTTAINHQEVIPLFDRQHRVVPNAAMVIDALPTITTEGTD